MLGSPTKNLVCDEVFLVVFFMLLAGTPSRFTRRRRARFAPLSTAAPPRLTPFPGATAPASRLTPAPRRRVYRPSRAFLGGVAV